MRICCISDTHGQHRKFTIPEGDVLIHSGDFMYSGRNQGEIFDFNEWLGFLPHKHKIVVAGNHDILFETQHISRTLLTNATYLENSDTEIGGLRFWGSPIQPEFNDWAFNVKRGRDIKKYWDMIPQNTDVLITHGPPHGIRDQVRPGREVEHLGCGELLKAVWRVNPTLHVFGHIHGGYGQCFLRQTAFVNASLLDERYQPTNKPIVVDIPTPRASHYGLRIDQTDEPRILGGELSR